MQFFINGQSFRNKTKILPAERHRCDSFVPEKMQICLNFTDVPQKQFLNGFYLKRHFLTTSGTSNDHRYLSFNFNWNTKAILILLLKSCEVVTFFIFQSFRIRFLVTILNLNWLLWLNCDLFITCIYFSVPSLDYRLQICVVFNGRHLSKVINVSESGSLTLEDKSQARSEDNSKSCASLSCLKSPLPGSGGTLSPSRHCHGDVSGHLHLPGLFRWLLVGLGRHCHALLLLQLPATPAEAPPRGEAEGAVSANHRDGAAELSPGRIPSSSTSTSTSTAAQGAAAVLPSSNPVTARSSAGSSSHASGKLGQHAR